MFRLVDLIASLPFPISQSCPCTSSLQLVQKLQPRQYNLLTRLLNLTGEEYLIEYRVDISRNPN